MQQDAFQFNLKQGNQETLIKGLTSCKCRLSSLSSWLKQSRLLQQRRSTHKHAVKSSTTSGRRPPLSPVDLQKDMLWFCYSLTNSVCCFQGWSQKTTTKKNPKHCPAFSLHRHSCSPLTQWWYQCCSALSRLPQMICRFYWLHLKIFTGCCSSTNPGLTCLLADPLRLFTHKRATGFCSMWIRTGSTVRRRPLSYRHSEEFCCREKLNFNKCSLTSRREQKLKRSVVSLLGCVTLITLSRSNTIVGLNRIYMARWEKCCKKAFRAQEEKRLHIVWAKWPHEKITDQ